MKKSQSNGATIEKKKVLFVIRSLRGGGAERALTNIVNHFPEDWIVDVLVNDENLIEYDCIGNILSLHMADTDQKLESPIWMIKEIIKRAYYLRKLKKKGNYRACISFLDSANISNILSGNKYCKNIISIRVSMKAKESKKIYRFAEPILMKLLYGKADHIVAVSEEIAEELKERYPKLSSKVTGIINGYDCAEILNKSMEMPKEAEPYQEKRFIVTTGRLDIQKSQWHLIRAFSLVLQNEPDLYLLILGRGKQKEYLQRLIDQMHLNERVILMGFSKNPYWYEAHAEAFVLPSMFEGFPNALAEAIICGAPCIATDFHSGAREILSPDLDVLGKRVSDITKAEYGILTPLCSGHLWNSEPLELAEKKLAEAIIELLNDRELNQYYRNQSIKRREQMGIDSIAEKWVTRIEQ